MPLLNVAVPAALWLWLCWHLHFDWSLNAQYNYGWAVPFLAIFLLYIRWKSRPVPTANDTVAAQAAIWILLFLLLPIRVVEEANPDWRFLSWVLALLVVTVTLIELRRVGGPSWVRHFAFPICFTLVAVPWPVLFEHGVVQALTRAVAYIAVDVAGWIGIAANQVGNIIQLTNGFVGVDEACSGVKTLQASLMVSLFLGELLMLTKTRRVMLVVVGCAWVLACNVVRATTLMVIAARSGFPALEHWHDLVGSAVLILGMGGLAGAALLLQRHGKPNSPRRSAALPKRFATTQSVAALAWLAFVFAGSELWYRAHERHLIPQPPWTVEWPRGSELTPIATSTAAILHYDDASSASWRDVSNEWWGFFARWEPRRAALQLVRSHSPEICLPATGRTFVRELAPAEVIAADRQLRFRVYEFVQEGRPLFVFVSIAEDKHARGAREGSVTQWSAGGRIAAALHGQRNLGQRLLELAMLGPRNENEARESLVETARQMVRLAPTG
ncbi:MAG: exosortase/archaeosortase family protein [Chthoniobacterales bacterium]